MLTRFLCLDTFFLGSLDLLPSFAEGYGIDAVRMTPAWERVAHHSHLYVLPAVGALSLGVGTLSLLGIHTGIEFLVPATLLSVGLVATLGSVASHLCLPSRHDDPSPTEVHHSPAVEAPARAARPPSHPQTAPSTAERLIPHSGIGRAALSHLEHGGDELWHHWSTPRVSPLGASLVGPVPETAYSPQKSGAVAGFPERDRDIVRISRPARVARSRPEAEQRPSVPLRPPPAPVVRPERESPRRGAARSPGGAVDAFGSVLAGRGGLLPNLDVLDYTDDLDSINPVLPRLGPGGRGSLPEPSSVRERAPTKRMPAKVCAGCSGSLSDFRSCVECRLCRRSFCRDCLPSSFQGNHGGTCYDCRAAQSRRSASNPQRDSSFSRRTSRAAGFGA